MGIGALSDAARRFLEASRVARLATAAADGAPHVVPVCYAVLDERTLAFAIDEKPKARPGALKRLRNLAENDRFALVVDRWDEDWRRLGYVLVSGRGGPCTDAARAADAVTRLRERYPQYVAMGLEAARHAVVLLRIERVHCWGELG